MIIKLFINRRTKKPSKKTGDALKKKYAILSSLLLIGLIFCMLLGAPETVTASARVSSPSLPILMYHQVTEKQSRVGKYVILAEEFENDLKYLKKAGYTTISMEQLRAYVSTGTPLPEKPVMITFDDGNESFYSLAFPLLKKYDMCAVVSVIGRYSEQYSSVEDHNINYSHLTWTEIKELSESGIVEIGHHSFDMHSYDKGRRGVRKNANESFEEYKLVFESDLNRLQSMLIEATGKGAVIYAYPFGYRCDESAQLLKENGFIAALTCAEKVNPLERDPDMLFSLGRFNRSGSVSCEDFFAKTGI